MQVTPTFEEFRARYAAGKPVLVSTSLVSDLETPVSAMLKLADGRPNSFLFESVEGGATRGRYSFIGLKPDLIWRCFGTNKLISAVSGVQLHDFGCSMKAYKRQVVDGIRLYGEMHRFLPIYVSWHGAKITEMIVNHHPRRTGSSKYGLERVLKVILDLLVVKFLDRAASKPMYVFGGCGIFSLSISLFTFLWMLGLKINHQIAFIATPLPLIVVMTFMIAMMCILLGLLAEMITRTFYESQGKAIYNIRSTRNFHEISGSPEPQADPRPQEDHYRIGR